MTAQAMNFRASIVVDQRFHPTHNGAIRVRERRIVEVGSYRGASREEVVDLGSCVVLPGLVNAHTHLDLGFTSGKVAPTADFPDWLARLMNEIRAAAGDEGKIQRSVAEGLRACLAVGTTLVGDITRTPAITRATIAATTERPGIVSFGEVIATGALRNRYEAAIASACDAGHVRNDLLIGISPHAPYTVERPAMDACVRIARSRHLPICIHAAEAPCEQRYMLCGDGPLREHLLALGVWDGAAEVPRCRPIAYLASAGALGSRTVLAHANYVNDDEIETLRTTRTSVAYCPRTHRAFQHDPHPFRKLLARGVNVCLGTDSLASCPSLSVLEEMRVLAQDHPDLDARTILHMGTQAGATALGLGRWTGVLAEGRRADLTAIPLDPHGPSDPLENILSSDLQPQECVVGGRRRSIRNDGSLP